MCINPFEDWGLPAAGKDEAEVKEEAVSISPVLIDSSSSSLMLISTFFYNATQRLCSVGQPLVGNLPSCSS